MFGPRPSQALKIADETVGWAVDIAAAMLLEDHDLRVARHTALEAAAAMWGAKVEPEIIWETEREL